MRSGRLLLVFLLCVFSIYAAPVTVLVTGFAGEEGKPDLNWIGESIADTLTSELTNAGEIALDRAARMEGLRRLNLKPNTSYTKATLFKLGETLDADMVCYGEFKITVPNPQAAIKDGSIRITARLLDLRKLRDAVELSESGQLIDLSRLEEHLAWQVIHNIDNNATVSQEELLKPSKLVRLEAKESYIRGLLAPTRDQKGKWFDQASRIDAHYTEPKYQLGRLAYSNKNYKLASLYFSRIPKEDHLYLQARFHMGLSAYRGGDYATAKNCFKELLQEAPLNEVFNNLGAAESRLGEAAAIDDFRKALEGDARDITYNFNVALAMYRQRNFSGAEVLLKKILSLKSDDADANSLLALCTSGATAPPAPATPPAKPVPAERIKDNFELNAFRQLKAMMPPSN